MREKLKVELFTSPGCNRCQGAKDMVQKVVEEIGEGKITYQEIDIVAEIDYAVQLGVFSASAIAVNGELLFAAVPSEKKLRKALQARL